MVWRGEERRGEGTNREVGEGRVGGGKGQYSTERPSLVSLLVKGMREPNPRVPSEDPYSPLLPPLLQGDWSVVKCESTYSHPSMYRCFFFPPSLQFIKLVDL